MLTSDTSHANKTSARTALAQARSQRLRQRSGAASAAPPHPVVPLLLSSDDDPFPTVDEILRTHKPKKAPPQLFIDFHKNPINFRVVGDGSKSCILDGKTYRGMHMNTAWHEVRLRQTDPKLLRATKSDLRPKTAPLTEEELTASLKSQASARKSSAKAAALRADAAHKRTATAQATAAAHPAGIPQWLARPTLPG